MSRMNYLSPEFLTDLTLIRYRSPVSEVLVEDNRPPLAFRFLRRFDFSYKKPFFEVPFASVEMCVIFGP
jgi:hypothetical protein